VHRHEVWLASAERSQSTWLSHRQGDLHRQRDSALGPRDVHGDGWTEAFTYADENLNAEADPVGLCFPFTLRQRVAVSQRKRERDGVTVGNLIGDRCARAFDVANLIAECPLGVCSASQGRRGVLDPLRDPGDGGPWARDLVRAGPQ